MVCVQWLSVNHHRRTACAVTGLAIVVYTFRKRSCNSERIVISLVESSQSSQCQAGTGHWVIVIKLRVVVETRPQEDTLNSRMDEAGEVELGEGGV